MSTRRPPYPHHPRRSTPHAPRAADLVRAAGTPGFTLTELVVAVGLVTILTLGIGRLFSTVTGLTGTGAAVAETDALARALETRLRADIAGLNALNEDEAFLVIRNTRLGGDRNFSSTPDLANRDDDWERDLYINREDRDADARGQEPPYTQDSRAVSVRMDELAFVSNGAGVGNFRSFQQDQNGRAPITAPNALVIYGHGLKRATDPDYDPNLIATADPANLPAAAFNNPVWRPDGLDPANRYDLFSAFGVVGSRNEFAGDFDLMRQQVLFFGGLATGFPDDPFNTDRPESPIGNDREYALYPRDLESALHFGNAASMDVGRDLIEPVDSVDLNTDPDIVAGGTTEPDYPNPRERWKGRTDIVAQSLATFRRWVEGEEDKPINVANLGGRDIADYWRTDTTPFLYPEEGPANADQLFVPRDATAFDSGIFDDLRINLAPGDPDFRLWRRFAGFNNTGNVNRSAALTSNQDAYYQNVVNLQSALAGVLNRPLYEPEPVAARRPNNALPDGVNDPADQRMDVHALLAQRCSSFEVAWSDGSVWQYDETLRVDTDGVFSADDPSTLERVIRRGDIIWFDMDFTRLDLWQCLTGNIRPPRLNPTDPFVPADARASILPNTLFNPNENDFVPPFGSLDDAQRAYPPPFPDPEIGDRRGSPSTASLFYPVDDRFEELDGNDPDEFSRSDGRLNRLNGFLSVADGSWTDPDNFFAPYSAQLTGGRLPGDGADNADEYLAVFGFRVPNGAGSDLSATGTLDDVYTGAWPKPRLLRVRATLHDRQFRLEGGRTYEFIFEIAPNGTR
ncbi:MAG: type II secretion system protein [Planctomycetota bacterium]